ncbi:MAG: HEAT repeat domain-containing protein [Acidobacteria bacterium]|nr:HEAT repeat domain-containing protein [Acidobacteriota bacterium]
MTAPELHALIEALAAEDVDDVLRSVVRLGERLPSLQGADVRKVAEALCGLFYVDVFDRPDLEPAIEAAEEALAQAGEPLIPLLIHLIEGSDIKSHLHIARVLGRIGAPSLLPLRRVLATAEDSYSRSFALYAIGKIRSEAVHEALPEVVGALMHPDKEVRDSAARALGKIVEAVPPDALTPRRRREIFEALCRAASDVQPAVRAKAARSLGKLAGRGYLDAEMVHHLRVLLEKLVTRGEETDWDRAYIVRREAIQALQALKDA